MSPTSAETKGTSDSGTNQRRSNHGCLRHSKQWERNNAKRPQHMNSEGEDGGRRALLSVLDGHRHWLESGGKTGEVADLRGYELTGADLRGVVLRRAMLSGVDLSDACLAGADLRETTLVGARLRGIEGAGLDLRGAQLRDADLTDADLRFANLGDVAGLLLTKLAGANLAGAQLPPDLSTFGGLEQVKEAADEAKHVFLINHLAAAYVWLTIANTSDVELLTNSPSSPLPIIGTEIALVVFYWVAPLMLAAGYIYFHVYLQRVWDRLAMLPAVFPDGRALDTSASSWVMTGLVRSELRHLEPVQSPMSRLQGLVAVVLAWFAIPVTIMGTWMRFLPTHNWSGTVLHMLLLTTVAVAGVLTYRLAATTLNRGSTVLTPAWRPSRKRRFNMVEAAVLLTVLVLIPLLSYGAIHGIDPNKRNSPTPGPNVLRTWIPKLFLSVGYSPFADFRDADVSQKPAMWSGDASSLGLIKGATLQGRNLRYADAVGAFLVNADLRGVDAVGADLQRADLRGAMLRQADLRGANLELADLRGAEFEETRLAGANLLRANLAGSDLRGLELPKAELVRANLQGARLHRANLASAFLNDANLAGAQLHRAILREAYLRDANLKQADLELANLHAAKLNDARLKGANLALANLSGADLRGADLREVTGLVCVQLQDVQYDGQTLFPSDLNCPDLW